MLVDCRYYPCKSYKINGVMISPLFQKTLQWVNPHRIACILYNYILFNFMQNYS